MGTLRVRFAHPFYPTPRFAENPAREREKDLLKIQQERERKDLLKIQQERERENLKKHKRAEKEAGRHESERRANVYIRNEKRVHIYIQ